MSDETFYNPTRYKANDPNETFEFLDRNPFATVISVAQGEPYISHIPMTVKRSVQGIELIGHLARANPHAKVLANSAITAIFHGPDAYITPKWYEKNDVPTWNYLTAHVRGECQLIEDVDGILACLRDLTAQVERHWPSGWEFFVPGDLAGQVLAKSIVGLKIKSEKIEFKKKLGQNKTAEGRAGVMRGLANRGDEGSLGLLEEMRKLFHDNGEAKEEK